LILVIVGVMLAVLPYVKVPDSHVWLYESFVTPSGGHYYYTTITSPSFPSGVPLRINFNVAESKSIDFYVMNELNYQKMNSSQTFQYYVEPSRTSISSIDLKWVPPTTEKIYFVWSNLYSLDSKLVSAYFRFDGTLLPPSASIFGFLFLFGGFGTISYGFHPPTSASSPALIKTGYVFATLGGIIGLIIGSKLAKKENSDDKVHGKAIMTIGLVSTIVYLLLWV
jgi:hypothetical protein